jgi:hypothetical protein
MRGQSAWPTRYRITVQPVKGDPHDYYVVTWAGPDQAVMMAAHAGRWLSLIVVVCCLAGGGSPARYRR